MTFSIRAAPSRVTLPTSSDNRPEENRQSAPGQATSSMQSTAEAGSGPAILLPSSSREQARANEIRQAIRGPLNQLTAKELSEANGKLVPARLPVNQGMPKTLLPAGSSATPETPARKVKVGVTLGPIDVTQKLLKRQDGDSRESFTDMVVSIRRGITQLKVSLANGIVGDNEGYARRSMIEWANRTYNIVAGNANAGAHVEKVAHFLYENWRPIPENGQGRQEQQEQEWRHANDTLVLLAKLAAQHATTGISIFGQDTKESPSAIALTNGVMDAMRRFAYRIIPDENRKKHVSRQNSRISLNFEVADAPKFAQRMVEVTRAHRNIRQSKIMGPLYIGKRVDDGIFYFGKRRPSLTEAKKIDKHLSAGLKGPAVRTAPPGMTPISAISSYAEYMPGTKGGHGSSRGKIVSEVVKQKLEGKEGTTASLMEEALARHGYDPRQPSLIKRG